MRKYTVPLIALVAIVAILGYLFWPNVPLSAKETTNHPFVGLAVRSSDDRHLGHVRSVYVVENDPSRTVHAFTVISHGLWIRGVRYVGKGTFEKRSVRYITLAYTYDLFRGLPRLDTGRR